MNSYIRSPRKVTLRPDLVAFAQLETGDRVLGNRLDGLLAGDLAQGVGGNFHQALIVFGSAEADVNDDLFELRYLMNVCQTEFFLEFGDKLLVVEVTLANGHGDRSSFGFDGFGGSGHYLISFPDVLKTRDLVPSVLSW